MSDRGESIMKVAFLASGAYRGPQPALGVWPVPAVFCDREVAGDSFKETITLCRRAEELGFDWISVSEHHYSAYMMTPNALVLAGALSQVIHRAKIALLGPLVPLNNPVRLAEEVAMLDTLTDGRIVVLFLRGTANEFFTYDTDPAKSRAMIEEGIDLILKAWTEPHPFSWAGEHYKFNTVSVWPRPHQEPHPPVFASGLSSESMAYAAKRRLGIAMSFAPPEAVAALVAQYRAACAKEGWEPTPAQVIYRGHAHVAESDDAAESSMKAHFDLQSKESARMEAEMQASAAKDARPEHVRAAWQPGGKAPPLAIRPYFVGSPNTVLSQIEALRRCGVGVLDTNFNVGASAQRLEAMRLFGERVLPEIRAW
jgi:alkanesulfonate monooxygenase SsuD/methylene tetrahydromethanopterin reductase-like flavin-dependent oxidoreductase (luciferase family)